MNKKFYSLCRSGNHAIIFWIINNIDSIDLNNSIPGIIYRSITPNKLVFVNNINHPVPESVLIPSNFDNTFVSYEDILPDYTNTDNSLIIIRDFYNTVASRYKLWQPYLGIKNQKYILEIQEFIETWKNMAELCLSNKINYIVYNKWISCKTYRDNIMKAIFNTSNTNDIISFVPDIIGSSYIGKNLESDYRNYLNRYAVTSIPKIWKDIIDSDNNLLSLNTKLVT